ncbi:MAG: TrmH family RNA methyltransferase [Bdellovibrionales bacterium]
MDLQSRGIRQVLQLGHKLEQQPENLWTTQERRQFELALNDMTSNNDLPRFRRLSQQIFEGWGAPQLAAINVSLERALNTELKEHDFLIENSDRLEKQRETFPLKIVLENIRSSFNVGSIFRAAECMGVQQLILTGYTSGPENQKTVKTTMNTHNYIDWISFPTTSEAVVNLKNQGYTVYAVETAEPSENLADCEFPEHSAIVFGNERFGLNGETLSLCDRIVRIPMLGVKNSLNVANACSMVMYEYSRQHG